METSKKSNTPLVLTILALVLVVGGSAHDFRLQQAKHAPRVGQKLQPTPTGWPVRSVITQGYQIALPNEFQIREDKQTGAVTFLKIVKLGVDQQSLIISRKKTAETDPCKTPHSTHTSCLNMFDNHVLEWGNNLSPLTKNSPEYLYTIIDSGYEYNLHFYGFPELEKSKILATFRTT